MQKLYPRLRIFVQICILCICNTQNWQVVAYSRKVRLLKTISDQLRFENV
jgi:hypothetical protein